MRETAARIPSQDLRFEDLGRRSANGVDLDGFPACPGTLIAFATFLKQANAILDAYGGDNVRNGVQVAVGGTSPMSTSTRGGITTVSVSARVTSLAYLERWTGSSAAGVVAHEGDHIINETQRLRGREPNTRQEWYNSERRGYTMQGLIDRALRFRGIEIVGGQYPLWRENWRGTPNAGALMTYSAQMRAIDSEGACHSCTGSYYAW